MRKLTLFKVLTVIGAMSIAGCGGGGGGGDIDTSKAQLTILTYDGGVGDQWLNNAARLFEAANKDRTDFESGKTGVQIHVTKQRIGGDSLLDTDLTHDMYFTENINYFGMTNKRKMADITDILTTANPSDGGKKIIDKVDDNLKAFMNREGHYYAVPFYDCIYGLFYDKDLFSDKKLYMTDGGIFTNNKAQFGTGPNGVKGDWDDGLPRTYEQFESLLAQMRVKNITPFTYSSNSNMAGYTARGLMSYWSDDEGVAQTNLNYSFNGQATNIVTNIVNGKAVTESVNITKENGYLLRKQAGLYNALHFADNILCATPDNYLPSSDVQQAQINFVVGKRLQNPRPVGMIFEGTWWQNEAVTAFNIAKAQDPEAVFNYGIMPIPKSSDAKVGEDATFLNLNASYGFINHDTEHMKLAKEFFSYLHTDSQLKAFTLETGMTRALNYTLSEEEYADVSSFTKDLIAIKQSEHAKMLYPYSNLSFVNDNPYIFATDSWAWSTTNLGDNPVISFINTSTSAETYFWQHANSVTQAQWAELVK